MKINIMYNKQNIMYMAHKFYVDGRLGDWAECLRKAWENAKAVKYTLESLKSEARTYAGWIKVGKEVIHGQKTAIQCVVNSVRYANQTTETLSFFTEDQVCDLGTQPPKGIRGC